MIKKEYPLSDEKLVQILKEEHKAGEYPQIGSVTSQFWVDYQGKGFTYLLKNYSSYTNDKSIFEAIAIKSTYKCWNAIVSGKYNVYKNAKLYTYFIRICINDANDFFKSAGWRNREEELGPDFPERSKTSTIEEEIDKEIRKDWLRKYIEKLDPRCQTILYYRYFNDFSLEEIKDIMGWSSRNVASNQVNRCIDKLIKIIKEGKDSR